MNLMTPELYVKLLKWIEEDKLVKFYSTRQWRSIRLNALRRDGYKCQHAKRLGQELKADTVHHVIPVRENPRLALDLSNLESINKSNHNREHPEKLNDGFKYLNEERW